MKSLINEDSLKIDVFLAVPEDSYGILNSLKQNLIEIKDFNEVSRRKMEYYETHGFLRKKVDLGYYLSLIRKRECSVYVAKIESGDIVGFASIYTKENNVRNIRTTLENIYADDIKIRELLLDSEAFFAYLDQVSVLPQFQRKGVGTALLSKISQEIDLPIVSFIVEKPLANIASVKWHEYLGFKLSATCDGYYKGEVLRWWIYIYFKF